MQGQYVIGKSGVEENMCWHYYVSGKLLLSVIWIKIFFHTHLLYKTNSAVSHLSCCNL